MDSMVAFMKGDMARSMGKKQMVFDWHRAAEIIKEKKPQYAAAGLAGDWEYTGGTIYENGQPATIEDTSTYLSSNWATPELEVDEMRMDCWIYEEDSPGWDSGTFWPESALKILSE